MLKDITLGQYFPGQSIIHRLDPRTKLIMLVVYIVALFLADKIGFYDIYDLVSRAVDVVPFIADPTLEEILEADRLAREAVRTFLNP